MCKFTGKPTRPATPFYPYDRGPLAGPSFAPLRMFLAASDAMADADSDQAESQNVRASMGGPSVSGEWCEPDYFAAGLQDGHTRTLPSRLPVTMFAPSLTKRSECTDALCRA